MELNQPEKQVFKVLQTFYIAPNGNTQVSWQLKVPDTYSTVKYQIVARTDKHADGEENVLPILSNRMLVTEAMPMPISGKAMACILSLKPINATSQPVIVVPTLEPYIIPNACRMLIRPALTKPRDATVTALDDYTIAVIKKPEKIQKNCQRGFNVPA